MRCAYMCVYTYSTCTIAIHYSHFRISWPTRLISQREAGLASQTGSTCTCDWHTVIGWRHAALQIESVVVDLHGLHILIVIIERP